MQILTTFLGKTHRTHYDSGVSAVYANYDGFLWAFPRKVRIRMDSRNSLYNAPGEEVWAIAKSLAIAIHVFGSSYAILLVVAPKSL